MDLGVDRLIEMFEERFGRRASNVLLFFLGLGALAWGIHAFVILLILPGAKVVGAILDYFKGQQFHLPSIAPAWVPLITNILSALVVGLIYMAVAGALVYRYRREAERETIKHLNELNEIEKRSKAATPVSPSPQGTGRKTPP